MPDYAWEPTPDRVEQANVTRLMRAAGVETINELRRRSVEDIDWYWDLVARDLALPFDEPYTARARQLARDRVDYLVRRRQDQRRHRVRGPLARGPGDA